MLSDPRPLISLVVSMDVKHHFTLLIKQPEEVGSVRILLFQQLKSDDKRFHSSILPCASDLLSSGSKLANLETAWSPVLCGPWWSIRQDSP